MVFQKNVGGCWEEQNVFDRFVLKTCNKLSDSGVNMYKLSLSSSGLGPKAEDVGISFWRKQKFVASCSPNTTETKNGLNVILSQHSEIRLSKLISDHSLS